LKQVVILAHGESWKSAATIADPLCQRLAGAQGIPGFLALPAPLRFGTMPSRTGSFSSQIEGDLKPCPFTR